MGPKGVFITSISGIGLFGDQVYSGVFDTQSRNGFEQVRYLMQRQLQRVTE